MSPEHRFPLRLTALLAIAMVLGASSGAAQPAMPGPDASNGGSPVGEIPADWRGAVRLLRLPGPSASSAESRAATEIFPDAQKVWMHVHGFDGRPVEAARRGKQPWVCSNGCELSVPEGSASAATPSDSFGDFMLRSIKLQTPVQPLPLTIWRPARGSDAGAIPDTPSGANTGGRLLFDPVLLGRRDYGHVCAYPPPAGPNRASAGPKQPATTDSSDEVEACLPPHPPRMPAPDSAELTLGLQWPRTSELADFQYVAVTDTCGNAWVQPFQRTFTVPAWEVASGGCGHADGRVLRVFPSGGWVRVTAFNLDAPAAGSVVSATFRVTVPPLEDLVSADTPPLLFPDPGTEDIVVDCGPRLVKAATGPGGIPRRGPGHGPQGQGVPPGRRASAPAASQAAPNATESGPAPEVVTESRPAPQPLAHQGLVIAPEPLLRGNCRLELRGQTKRRLVAPLALRVVMRRTDTPMQPVMFDESWIVTPQDYIFYFPPLSVDRGFDGESRLRLEIYSDPLSADGNVVLLSDAGRIARVQNVPRLGNVDKGEAGALQRLIGSVTVHSAPLCGEANFETVEAAGSCLRGYFTVPAMLATLQITRAPWVERPLITRSILSAVGVAFALDSYDPVERKAFPIAFHVGGFVQDLGEERMGLLAYVGVAPTVPILGEGGNTTSIGLLGGLGLAYVANNSGPDEGVKPAAFLSVIVQIGQANPSLSGQSSFGTYSPQGPGSPSRYGASATSPSGYGSPYGQPTGSEGRSSAPYGTSYGATGSSDTGEVDPEPTETGEPGDYGGYDPSEYGGYDPSENQMPPPPDAAGWSDGDWPMGYDDYDLGAESYDYDFTE